MTKPKREKAAPKPKPAKPSNGSLVLPDGLIELCAAKSDIRWYLNWPYLDMSDRKKPMLVASNGHVLAASPVHIKGSLQSGPIPLEAIAAAREAAKKAKTPTVTLTFKDHMVGTPEQMFKRPELNFTFPDYRKILTALDPGERGHDIALNGDYMSIMHKAVGAGEHKGIRLFCARTKNQIDPANGVVVKAATGDTVGVVMPMRL